MQKLLNGSANIGYGGTLPNLATSFNGTLFHKDAGPNKGLYIVSGSRDGMGQGPLTWRAIVEPDLYVLRAGDTMTGPLIISNNSTAATVNIQRDSLTLKSTTTTTNSYSSPLRWKVGDSTGSQISNVITSSTSSGIVSALSIATQGPTDGLTERIRIDHNGISTPTGETYWHSGNDGAGSGLDSDLLDGQTGSYYLDLTNATNTLSLERLPFIPVQQGGGVNQIDTKIHIGGLNNGRLALQMGTTNHGTLWPIDISGTASSATLAVSANQFINPIRLRIGFQSKEFTNTPLLAHEYSAIFDLHEAGAVTPLIAYGGTEIQTFYVDVQAGVDDYLNANNNFNQPYKTVYYVINNVLPRYTGTVIIKLANAGTHNFENSYVNHSHTITISTWYKYGSSKANVGNIMVLNDLVNLEELRINSVLVEAKSHVGIKNCDFIGSKNISHPSFRNAVAIANMGTVGFSGNISWSGTYYIGIEIGVGSAYPYAANPNYWTFNSPVFNETFMAAGHGCTINLGALLGISGSFTGSRFKVYAGGSIYTATGNLDLLPGTIAGDINDHDGRLPSYYY